MHIYRNGKKWRVQLDKFGVRESGTFETKAAAQQWGHARETELLAVKRGAIPNKTFADALIRYRDEISPKKKGFAFERKRIDAFLREFPKLAANPLQNLSVAHLAVWRDIRLKAVTKGTVQRDINLFSNVFTVARDEWRWCTDSPFRGFRAPGDNPPRTRRILPGEIKRIARHLGYVTGRRPRRKSEEVALAFLISLRTGMRAGEILSLTPARIDVPRRVALVPHKTEHLTGRPREVPLSRHALRLLRVFTVAPATFVARQAPAEKANKGFAWSITSASLDALFRKARDSLLIHDLHFHDARADALTRFAKKVDVMQLARVSGHKDLRILMEHYYRVTPAEIARSLDAPTPSRPPSPSV
jgi:integrase